MKAQGAWNDMLVDYKVYCPDYVNDITSYLLNIKNEVINLIRKELKEKVSSTIQLVLQIQFKEQKPENLIYRPDPDENREVPRESSTYFHFIRTTNHQIFRTTNIDSVFMHCVSEIVGKFTNFQKLDLQDGYLIKLYV